MRHTINQRFTCRHDGMIQVTLTFDYGDLVSSTTSLATLMGVRHRRH